MRWDLEEIAREALESTNVGAPVDPEIIAIRKEIEVRDCGANEDGFLVGRVIYVPESHRRQRRAFAIAHELAHWFLRCAGLPDDEASVNYLAAALLLPRDDFERDLRRVGWDLIALCARHRWASFEACARRIVALRDARVHVFDKPLAGQRKPGRYSIPYGLTPTTEERIAAAEAVRCGAPVEIRTGLTAFPVLEHDWHRAITLMCL